MTNVTTKSFISDDSQQLGGRLPLLRVSELTGKQRQLYESLSVAKKKEAAKGGYTAAAPNGELLGPFNSYLFIPEIAEGYIAWIEAQHEHSPFEPEVRETVILTVGTAWKAEFVIYAHAAVARTEGMAASTIEGLIFGHECPELSPRATVARRFTSALIFEHEVKDYLYQEAKQTFGDSGVIALTHLIGLYISISAVLKAFRVPLPYVPTAAQQ